MKTFFSPEEPQRQKHMEGILKVNSQISNGFCNLK
jgi:hypothetical protein